MSHWQTLTLPFTAELQYGLHTLHHATQLVGMFSNSFLPKQLDDSQSNLGWSSEKNSIVSHVVSDTIAFLDIKNWEWKLVNDKTNKQFQTEIAGKTKSEAFQWFKSNLHKLGFDQDNFEYFKHFSLPYHEIDNGVSFVNLSSTIRNTLTKMQTNASIALHECIESLGLGTLSPVRIWPHHFDMASLIIIETDVDHNPTKTIGIGWAMPDDEIDEPYFYTNHWIKKEERNYDNLPSLNSCGKWHTSSWVGITIKYSDILNATNQYETIKEYFTESIRINKQILTDLKPT